MARPGGLRKSQVNIVREDDRNASDDDILDQNEVVMNTRLKQADPTAATALIEGGGSAPAVDGDNRQSYSRLKSTEDIRKEIEKMGKKLQEEQKQQQAIEEHDKESDPTSQSDAEKG